MRRIEKILIVQHQYGIITPKTQRMLAAARVYVRLGLEVVFIVSTDDPEFDAIQGVRFIKIEEKRNSLFKCYCHFQKIIKEEYDDSSIILFYEIPLYAFLFRKKKYNSFAEITEIPFYGKKLSFTQKVVSHIRLFALRGFKGLFVISKGLKDYYENMGIANIEVINMFVDYSRFAGLSKQSNNKYVTYCGTVSFYKDGVDILITAFAKFLQVFPEYKLKIIGQYENYKVAQDIQSLIVKLGIVGNVELTGPVDPSLMPQLLYDASILALARPHNKQSQYGFPTKLGEYLATGNPVCVTRVGEIPSFLHDNVNAFIAEPDNPDSFADALIRAASNSAQAAAVGKEGQKLVHNEFSSDVQSCKIFNFLLNKIAH